MSKLIDLTGRKFGRLVVIKRVDNDKWGHHRWLCKCKDENEVIVFGNDLKVVEQKVVDVCLKKVII